MASGNLSRGDSTNNVRHNVNAWSNEATWPMAIYLGRVVTSNKELPSGQ